VRRTDVDVRARVLPWSDHLELTGEQESEVQAIMAEMDCPSGFPCYASKFESLTPARVLPRTTMVECPGAEEPDCGMFFRFGSNTVLCECPLRKYVALKLGR